LQALAPRWQGKRTAFPSDDWIAQYTGYSVRVVRDDVRELEREQLLKLRRERLPNGHERIVYMPGPALLAGAVAFLAAYPERTRAPARPAAKSAGGVPAESAEELSDLSLQNGNPVSSSSNLRREGPPKQEESGARFTETDRDVARTALADLRAQRFPDRAPVPMFDAADVDMVSLCAATIPGDAAAKSRAMTDAIDNAFESSKGLRRRGLSGAARITSSRTKRGTVNGEWPVRRQCYEPRTSRRQRASATERGATKRGGQARRRRSSCGCSGSHRRPGLSAREAAPSPVPGARQP
jgi:hypothetical protein